MARTVLRLVIKFVPKFIKKRINFHKTDTYKFLKMWNLNSLARKGIDNLLAGENILLDQLTKRLNINNGFVMDIGAGDGFSQSVTLGFFRRKGWSGLAVELDPVKFSRLSFIYANFPNVLLARNRVTPSNILFILDAFEVPKEISFLNLDIDSFDLFVIKKILNSDYKPKIIQMEVNEKIPSGIFFTVNYDDNHYWQSDHFYGCSLGAASLTIKPFGYLLYALQYNNAIFIRNDLVSNDFSDLTAEEAYNNGYKNKDDREKLFPWNADVEQWLHSETDESTELIRQHFKKYEGKFTLHKI